VIGAKVRDTPELLSLLPPRSNDARDCAFCEGEGSGWVSFMMDIHGKPIEMVCAECGGVGWLTRS
jgi:DnaJ-class molecular chaperone